MSVDPSRDYPLAEKHPDWVRAPSGLSFQEITLEKVLAGEVGVDDLRITAETLRRQADIAEASGYAALAANLRRAAELTTVPNERLLAVYNALRPHRATRQEVDTLCDELETLYGACETVAFIRTAIPVYEAKGLFRRK
ncbi:MAG: diol dehydratase small subunit [Candidatus Latescibacteria bacterium]|nr:diol dehydratase small subunit [Candidatus Latescibacterota bacterium]